MEPKMTFRIEEKFGTFDMREARNFVYEIEEGPIAQIVKVRVL
jgi:hypothetical protein